MWSKLIQMQILYDCIPCGRVRKVVAKEKEALHYFKLQVLLWRFTKLYNNYVTAQNFHVGWDICIDSNASLWYFGTEMGMIDDTLDSRALYFSMLFNQQHSSLRVNYVLEKSPVPIVIVSIHTGKVWFDVYGYHRLVFVKV